MSRPTYLQDISIGFTLIRVLELSIADKYGVHIGASILIQLVVAGNHNYSNLNITEDAQLVGLLQQASLTLAKGYLVGRKEVDEALVLYKCSVTITNYDIIGGQIRNKAL